MGWLLLAPLVVGVVVAPGALGAYAAGQQSDARSIPKPNFDLAAYLRAQDVTGHGAQLPVADFLSAADDPDDRPLLARHDVQLVGFVAPAPETAGADTFLLTRFLLGCCAGDAIAMQVEVRGAEPPPTDQWVEVTARYHATPGSDDDAYHPPVVDAVAVREIDRPRQPYEVTIRW
jgi:uncharacterized repeat protein (TIGR03943 family)